ncbi:hypothetical protein RKS58_23420 [Lysinibacillus capsici]|uniref:hypothetical protein n=1 Tax=Lysinibacillus capsici TaxID=2115968 RepID=UPI0028BD3D06|nr:hypothetical protein [Lysinibacillus capsici]WNN76206.1 hypothetical protein RKS58_23420 [Lysinibacillus capsici]
MRNFINFSIAGSLMTMIFLGVVNYTTSPQTMWFVYPCLLLLIWPITLFFMAKKLYKQYSIVCSALIITFLIVENYIYAPDHLWFVYAIYPIIWWPILMYLDEKAKTLKTALIGCASTIIYYSILNMIVSPQYPWVIYPAFLVIWWPLALYHAQRKTFVAFSVTATILISIFFITVNVVSSPSVIWAIYPIFVTLWWPLSMYFYVYKRKMYHASFMKRM